MWAYKCPVPDAGHSQSVIQVDVPGG